ncbi:tripartite tricarboxylate transporter substrate binding protein [Variovorax sp. J31P207]|uniref:Bug family tripartite tricarboxylate transporter substrate binding protein n=1 Tax=Variovorax sp. J31P207 TaxID=3053510 RepID=UPI002576A88E|nr:tripartite tricarboxylate transporter substrate binding protein [Variovorax sp. J31P207]MDM0072355.1 tripartite tricarboxylate transporter substrate binding protein [Variovorax sp. J31P207]
MPVAHAQHFPAKPIHFVIGSAPGSVIDVVTRQIAEGLARELQQPVVVENRFSAGGIVALETLKSTPPGGYTLSVVAMPQMSVSPSLFKQLPYDPVKDFTPIGILYRGPQFLVVNSSVRAASLTDLIAYARAHPGRLRYSSPGNGTPSHVLMEQFKHEANIDVQHIPYKGPSANTAVLSGEVDALLEGVGPMIPYVRSGALRALAVTGSRRVDMAPEVPTFEELGIKGVDAVWVGVIAPRDLKEPVVSAFHQALSKALQDPGLRASFEAAGRTIHLSTPEEMTAVITEEIPRWREVVQRAGIAPQ